MLTVPVAKRLALLLGIVDSPDKHRKLHGRVVPLTGGLLLLAVLPTSLAAAAWWDPTVAASLRGSMTPLLGLAVGAGLLLVVGLADDRWGVRGRQKLLAQIISSSIILGAIWIDRPISVFSPWLPLGMAFAVLVIWLVGSINAVNLIDGADGLASTVGIVAATSLYFLTFDGVSSWQSDLALSLSGTLIGFLVYNFPPASTFLGDGGSMLIGLLLGFMALSSSVKEAASVALCAPVAIVAIPFFDSFVAILRRRLTGRSIYSVDRGHLHHRLLERGMSPRRMLGVVAGLCVLSGLGGVLSLKFNSPWFSLVSVSLVVGVLVLGRLFGYSEFRLLAHKLVNLSRSFMVVPQHRPGSVQLQSFRLQGTRNWDYLWEALTEFAERHHLKEVRLDLNLPWLHEGYHAVWQRQLEGIDVDSLWQTRLPLCANSRLFGHVQITGPSNRGAIYPILAQLSDLLESMETVIQRLALSPDAIEEASTEQTDSLQVSEVTQVIRIDSIEQEMGRFDTQPINPNETPSLTSAERSHGDSPTREG
ncbi:MAG: MraY family glycosyltransferase [Pirellulaceae bacterium]